MESQIVSIVVFLIVTTTLISIIKGAPYVPTSKMTLQTILSMAGSLGNKRMIDLGSGDGRVLQAFLTKGADVVGYEINPILYAISYFRLIFDPRKSHAHVYLRSLWSADLSQYDVIVVFGISYIMKDLEKKIRHEAKKGTLVIAHSYEFPNWKPAKVKNAVYLYKV